MSIDAQVPEVIETVPIPPRTGRRRRDRGSLPDVPSRCLDRNLQAEGLPGFAGKYVLLIRMPLCNSCEGFVTPEFARVFGDNDDRIDGCLHCETARTLYQGGAVGDDRTARRDL